MSRLRSWFVLLACLAVGGTFVVAGFLKSLDVTGFARDIALHGIVGPGPSAVLARVLVPFEIVAGTAAIIGYRRRIALALIIGSLAVFIGATAYAWSQGNTEGCGCFGRFAARTPLSVIIEDLVLLALAVPALLLARGAEDRMFSGVSGSGAIRPSTARARWRAPLIAAVTVLSTAFAFASPYLPIDNFATSLKPGVHLSELGLDRITGNLAEGDRLLVILDLDDPSSQRAIASLNALAQAPGAPAFTALTSAGEEKRAEFFWSHAPAFDFVEVPAADLRRLFRRAPRSFRVHNGRVSQVWDGVPRLEELAH